MPVKKLNAKNQPGSGKQYGSEKDWRRNQEKNAMHLNGARVE
jgi:hypothetical protein